MEFSLISVIIFLDNYIFAYRSFFAANYSYLVCLTFGKDEKYYIFLFNYFYLFNSSLFIPR
jgi:hypothetical protein